MSEFDTPPGMGADERVVLFDGVCRLCAAWARFLIRFDRHRRFRLASMQSPEGQAILTWLGLPLDEFDTLLLVEPAAVYGKSAACIKIVARLPFPWSALAASWLIPRPLRDWVYDRIARNRYRLFGRFAQCGLPAPDHDARYL